MLPEFELIVPKTLEEALEVLSEKGESCQIAAGGTDVYVDMHAKFESAPYVLDIKRIPGLDGVSYVEGEGVTMGTLVTHHFLDRSPFLRSLYPALCEGASQVGSVQIRHRGTIGGNICNAVPSGDTLGPLLALDAEVILASSSGERRLPIEDFILGPKVCDIAPDELLCKIFIPDPGKKRSRYIKFTRRGAMDLALLGATASLGINAEGVAQDVRIALTTCAKTPMRAREAEAVLEGKILNDDSIVEAGLAASAEAHPRTSWRCTEEYRREVLKEIVPQAIIAAAVRAREEMEK